MQLYFIQLLEATSIDSNAVQSACLRLIIMICQIPAEARVCEVTAKANKVPQIRRLSRMIQHSNCKPVMRANRRFT